MGVRSENWNLLVSDGGSESRLFDLDETSRMDVSERHPEVVAQLRAWLSGVEERNALLTEGLDASAVQLDEETRQRLKELGYLR